MSTWMEFDQSPSPRRERTQPGGRAPSFTEHWQSVNDRRGTGKQTFVQRLSRARLLYLRRDEHMANWLALSLLFCALVLPEHDMWPAASKDEAPRASLRGDSFAAGANFNPQ